MNFKEVLLVVNPISGNTDKKRIITLVQEKLSENNIELHIYSTTGEDDKKEIRSIIEEKNIDRVIVAGGDGTINLVAEAIKKMNIPLGIIPAGSANGLAVNLELPGTLPEQIETALGENYIDLDILCLNDIVCLHMSDLGINAELIQNYETSSIRGKFGYLVNSIPTLIKSEYPYNFHIKANGIERKKEAVLLGFANATKYGTGAVVNPKGKPNDGVFEILLFKRLNLGEILKTLRNEVDFDPEIVEIIPAKSAVISCKRPVAFQIDGEYKGKQTNVEIKILDEKLKIAIP